MAKGGKQPGAGRPKGSTTSSFRQWFKQSWTKEEFEELMQHLHKRALKEDRVAMWLIDQLMGKAVQRVAGEDEEGEGFHFKVKII